MYVLRQPARELAAFIEHYWFVLDRPSERSDLHVEVFVDARADLIFTFGAPYRREVINGSARQVAYANVDAQRLVPIRIVQRGSVRVAGVRFRLGGLGPFTDAHLADWSGATPRPEMILGAYAVRLETELRDTPDPDDAAVALDGFFREQLGRHGPHPGFWRALDVLQDSGGRVSVAELAGAADVSLRHLERLFARELGFSPRTVARVLRFQRVLGCQTLTGGSARREDHQG